MVSDFCHGEEITLAPQRKPGLGRGKRSKLPMPRAWLILDRDKQSQQQHVSGSRRQFGGPFDVDDMLIRQPARALNKFQGNNNKADH